MFGWKSFAFRNAFSHHFPIPLAGESSKEWSQNEVVLQISSKQKRLGKNVYHDFLQNFKSWIGFLEIIETNPSYFIYVGGDSYSLYTYDGMLFKFDHDPMRSSNASKKPLTLSFCISCPPRCSNQLLFLTWKTDSTSYFLHIANENPHGFSIQHLSPQPPTYPLVNDHIASWSILIFNRKHIDSIQVIGPPFSSNR